MRTSLRALGTLLIVVIAWPAAARSLRDNLPTAARNAGIVDQTGAFNALADAISDTAARDVPVLSASAGYTYRYDPTIEAFVRSSETLGPIFLERPDTIGRGKFNINVSAEYAQLDQIDGRHTSGLHAPDQIVLANQQGGVAQPRTSNDLLYTFKLISHVEAVSLTYGVLDDLDVNLLLPLMETDFDVTARNTQRTVETGGAFVPAPGTERLGTAHGSAIGIGDILLRAKYQLPRFLGVRQAAGLVFRLPSGSQDDLQGAGTFEASPSYYLSDVFWGSIEPHANFAVDLRADDVARSQARYDVGVDYDIVPRVGVSAGFLGRSQFERSSPKGETDFAHLHNGQVIREPLLGIDFDRKDYFDLSFGVRAVVWRQIMVFANAICGLNNDGLRSSTVIPVAGVEGTF